MTQKYATSKALAIVMIMEILWMCCHHYWLSRFPLANWSPWLKWSSRSRGHTLTWNQQKQTTAATRQADIVWFISSITTLISIVQNSETQLHIQVIPPDPEVIVLVRWGSNVKEQHTTYSYNSPFYVCLYMMIGGLRGNLKPTVTLIAYWDISGHTSSFSASPTTTWGGLCDHQGLIIE